MVLKKEMPTPHGRTAPLKDMNYYSTYLKRCKGDSQNIRIVRYMLKNGGITTMQAINHCDCTRLASRICELKAFGLPITDEWLVSSNGKRCKIYRIEEKHNV